MRVFRPLLVLLLVLLPLAACGGGADCLAFPCALPAAITLTVSSAVVGGDAPVATVEVSGASQSSFSCSGMCRLILGSAGVYHIVVSAPGFTTAERSVVVRGTNPPCGCANPITESVSIALSPAA